MERIESIIHSKKFKHTFFIVFILSMLGWACFRFFVIATENSRDVYNIARVSSVDGVPVESMVITTHSGVLYEPVSVKDNRAHVSAARAENLSAGQRLGKGTIASVSHRVNLNTGMYLVRTAGVSDGLQFAEFSADGHFVPLYAIKNNQVFVAENGVATVRDIVVSRQDSENAFVSSGLNDGDIVILSAINAGDKVQIINN